MITAILNFSTERKKFFLSYLFFLALSIRLCIVFLYSILPISKIEINADYEYGIIARAIADGKGYSYPIVEFDSNFAPKNIIGYRPSANQLPFFPYLLILKDFPSIKNIAITGLLMGVTVLNNNVITSFFPLIGIWLLMNLKMAFWNKLWKVSLVFSISILVITPCLIRNFLIFN